MKSKILYQANKNKDEGRILLTQMDLLKRYFGITARQVYEVARVNEQFGNKVLHGKKTAAPTMKKITNAIFRITHSKGLCQVKNF